MKYDEPLVGLLAIVLALVCMVIAVGRWQTPYRLRTIATICERFGKPAARSVWLVLALAAFGSGIAILSGVRPGYAEEQVVE
jgi:hypothetical protein